MTRLIFKLLFKACLPLAMLVGVMSYGLYLSGGDPGAVFSRVAGGAIDTLRASVRQVAGSASDSLNSVAGGLSQALGDDGPGPAGTGATRPGVPASNAPGSQAFFTWTDASGIKHYSSVDPLRDDSRLIEVDPDTNLIAAVPVSSTPGAGSGQARGSRESGSNTGFGDRRSDSSAESSRNRDEALPGMAGMALPEGTARDALLEMLR